MAGKPYDRVTVDGHTLDRKTAAAFAWADKRFRRKYPGRRLELAQGSYNTGVAASAGTHDGGGVIDVRVSPLTAEQATYARKVLKRAGFAAWSRDHRDGMDPHIHACLLAKRGRHHRTMAWLAQQQCDDYLAGRSGLASHGPDRNPWRPRPQVVWSWKRRKPVRR